MPLIVDSYNYQRHLVIFLLIFQIRLSSPITLLHSEFYVIFTANLKPKNIFLLKEECDFQDF